MSHGVNLKAFRDLFDDEVAAAVFKFMVDVSNVTHMDSFSVSLDSLADYLGYTRRDIENAVYFLSNRGFINIDDESANNLIYVEVNFRTAVNELVRFGCTNGSVYNLR